MSAQFKRKESATCAVRRIHRRIVEDALECLKQRRPLNGIHGARKGIKKSRALLRLMRSEMNCDDYQNIVHALRNAAKRMADARDAHVRLQAVKKLIGHYKNQLRPRPFAQLKKWLRENCREKTKRFWKRASAKSTERLLRKTLRQSKKLKVNADGWRAICPGLKRSYDCGRKLQDEARKNPAPENFHEWRKRVKDLWHQLCLLRPIWREEICAEENELKMLGDYLGDDHDFVMLKNFVAEKGVKRMDAKQIQMLNRLIESRQTELRSAALALGSRFYAVKPSAFCKRLENYWKIWKREKK